MFLHVRSPLLLGLALVVIGSMQLRAQSAGSLNMTLFDHVNPVDTAGLHAAVWGYAAPDGREYAFLGSQIGTYIVDVTTRPIRQVAFIPGPRNQWREMKTYGEYLYVSSEAFEEGAGLQIIDLSELPQRATLVTTSTEHFVAAHTIFIRDHYLYAMGTAAQAGANGGVIILDLEPDPVHPRLVGKIDRNYYHDAWVRNDTLVAAGIYGTGIDIFDIRDKTSPTFLANINYPGSGTHNVEITPDGRHLVSSDEIGATPKTMKVWEISDLENVRMVAEYTPHVRDIVHNVHAVGRYVYAAWYTGGVRIIDMIDPTRPREVGFYDTYPAPNGGFLGVWEVYAHLPSGKIIAGDREAGLYVLEFNGAVGASVSGTVRDAATGEPVPDVLISIDALGRLTRSDALGNYYVGADDGSSYRLDLSRFGYISSSVDVALSGDVRRDILIERAPVSSIEVTARTIAGEPLGEFAYAVDPILASRPVIDGIGRESLPLGLTYTFDVARWGYLPSIHTVRPEGAVTPVQATLAPRYRDNATNDLGWTYGTPEDDATGGRWTRSVLDPDSALGSLFYPTSQPNARRGHVFSAGTVRQENPELFDVDGGVTTLISPRMDLSGYDHAFVNFRLWYFNYRLPNDPESEIDSFTVDISSDDGATWVRALADDSPRIEWRHRVFPAKSFVTLTDRVRVRFQARDVGRPSIVIAAIDNFDVSPTFEGAGLFDESSIVSGLAIAQSGNDVVVSSTMSGSVRVELFDNVGSRIASLRDGMMPVGTHRFPLPPGLSSGFYYARVVSERGAVSAPIVVAR